jgi:N-acetylglucosaminyldiphosphoundecaprenol N-acetyl-beta-D-mannosaminyltransferase
MSAATIPFSKCRVITVDISIAPFAEQVAAIADLGAGHHSSYVCCVNAHMTMEARDAGFAQVVNNADLATADGMPIVKSLGILHGLRQERVAGNDLLPAMLAEAERRGLSVFFYGGAQAVLDSMLDRAVKEYPGLRIAGSWSPPFGPLDALDLEVEADRVNSTGAHIVMVSLGCPKQERWMASMKGRVDAVMLGLGGAFLLYAGVDSRAPQWMRNASLEWVYRLALEPRRLWKRYLVTNSLFLFHLVKQVPKSLSQRGPGGIDRSRTQRTTSGGGPSTKG